ncbi:MAG TPA: hypothetical protein PLX15_00300 [Candidatus Woesearchaeota archaeon]|nr:hypothetical protein [Candidatus Woesearchaeota archaeon]
MFDVSRLQDATKLAKDLVDRGIAKNYEEAHKMIEEQNMVKTEGEVSVVCGETKKKEQECNCNHKECSCDGDNKEVLNKIESLEKTLKTFSDFLTKYAEQNDKNMQEVDERLKRLEQNQSLKPEIQKKIQASNQRPADKPISGNGEGLNPNDFSVEKFFNNAHGKMEKK